MLNFRASLRAGPVPILVLALATPLAGRSQEALCQDAARFLTDDMDMAAVTEVERIDDWRTGRQTSGCRVTAAGLTRHSSKAQAEAVFQRLRALGWARSPDPRDAPNEASLRFRKANVDCLFSFYTDGLLGTEAEARVDDARIPGVGEIRYNFLVLCVPAAEAKPRE